MTRLPQRPRQHELDAEGVKFAKSILPSRWVVHEIDAKDDYGIDLVADIVSDLGVMGAYFSVQVKGTDNLRIVGPQAEYVTAQIKTSTLALYLARPELIVLLVYDARDKIGYWIWIQDYVREQARRDWPEQKTLAVRIPRNNRFDAEAVTDIATRVLSFHERSKWLSAVETAQNPQYKYTLETSEEGILVDISTRYRGAEQDNPAEFNFVLKFDQTDPEAHAKLAAIERHFKTGERVEIEPRFIESAELPKAWSDLLGHERTLIPRTIVLSSAPSAHVFRYQLIVRGPEGQVLGEIPQITFRVVQGGTEEVTLSNEADDASFLFKLRVPFGGRPSAFLNFGFQGKSVAVLRKLLALRDAIARGTSITLTSIDDEMVVFEAPYALDSISDLDSGLIAFVEDLALIQEKTGQLIRWSGPADQTTQRRVRRTAHILKSGQFSEETAQLAVSVGKEDAIWLRDRYSVIGRHLIAVFPEQTEDILGTPISLGPVRLEIPNTKLSDDTVKHLGDIENMPEDAVIPLEFVIEEGPVLFSFPRWLPELPAQHNDQIGAP